MGSDTQVDGSQRRRFGGDKQALGTEKVERRSRERETLLIVCGKSALLSRGSLELFDNSDCNFQNAN
jgi:hypothetical protein